MILLLKSYPYHFVCTILSVPFCPIPFCPYTILSILFCPYHFVRYHFVLEPFRAVVNDPCHVLSRLLPEVKSTSYNLWPRAHCFVLPTKDTRNFIPRMLYEKIYCK